MNIIKLGLVSALAFNLGACVNLQILPENSIKNSVEAGKNLIDEAKVKSSGGKKMALSSEYKIETGQTRPEAEKACLSEIKARANEASPKRNYELVNEKTRLGKNGEATTLTCEISVFVWR